MGPTSDALKRIDHQTAAPVILPLAGAGARNTTSDPHADRSELGFDGTPSPARFFFPALPTKPPTPMPAPPEVVWPSNVDAERSLQAADAADAILRRWPLDRMTILAITSAGPDDGKTRWVTALAPQLARRVAGGVLVVDANMRHPSLTSLAMGSLDVTRPPGLIYPTNLRRLNFLPAPEPRQEWESRLDQLWIAQLREDWLLVLMELPSLMYPKTVRLCRHCDGVYLAARLGHTSQRALRRAAKILRRAGGHLAGCLVIG